MRGRVSPKWEAEVGGHASRSGRPCKAEVGGRARPKWEAEV